MEPEEHVSITTFNILAPQYFRSAEKGVKEAHLDPAVWEKRNEVIAQYLVQLDSDIVCLQEFWLPEEGEEQSNGLQMLNLYRKTMSAYDFTTKQRTGRKQDGLVIAFKREKFEKVAQEDVDYEGVFHHNRVGLLVHLRSIQGGRDLFVGTTHVMYPNWALEARFQVQQITLLCEHMEEFVSRANTQSSPFVAIAGDFNTELPKARQQRDSEGANPIVESFMKVFQLGVEWFDVIQKHNYQSSFDVINSLQNVVTHINHDNKQTECDFVLFKGSAEVVAAEVNPSHVRSNLNLLRPLICTGCEEFDLTLETIMNTTDQDFHTIWARVSDHRPKSARFALLSNSLL